MTAPSTCTTRALQPARARRVRHARGQRRGRLPALVHGRRARRRRSSRWCRPPTKLVDEAARAGQLHRLRHLRAGGDGRVASCSSSTPAGRAGQTRAAGGDGHRAVLFEPVLFRKNPPRRCRATGRCTSASRCSSSGGILLLPPAHRRRLPPAGGARRPHVPLDRGRLRLLHHRHHPRRVLGRRGLGRLLELGPEGDLGADRLAELRRLAAHAADEGAARHGRGPGGR